MERLVCLALVCVAAALADTVVNPRGARPVEHGTRDEKCATQKEWPFCTDQDLGPKCPSGCRIQGLLDKYDHSLLKKVEKARTLLDQNKVKSHKADQTSKQTYSSLTEKLTTVSGTNDNYYSTATDLRTRITTIKITIHRQLRTLAALRDRVKDQVAEMQKLEVDIDIKLRSCKGSCARYSEYQVDKESYVALDKQVNQLNNQVHRESAGALHVMKSRPLQRAATDSRYKSTDVAGQQEMFANLVTQQFVIESDGSGDSLATVYKHQGTDNSLSGSSSPASSASSSSTSSSTITLTSTCTRTTRTTTVITKAGPEERTEEVIEGGPECQNVPDSAFSDPSITSGSFSTSFTSSSSMTNAHHSGDTKGSILGDFKSSPSFGDIFGGMDSVGFSAFPVEDDHPNLQARSATAVRVERQADYVGQDCVEANKNHLKGETNGLFKIKPGGTDSTKVVEVYCQQEGLMGGWLLVQQRESGALGFNRTWAEYRDGFGSVDARGNGEFWLGNQNLHLLTNQGETMLKVELEDWEGGTASAEYTIRVCSEEEGFLLHVSGYAGEAGDALATRQPSHNGMKFSTFDRDNDKWEGSCAETYGGGWWYNNCQSANLNGIYYRGRYDAANNQPYQADNGVVWVTFKNANYSLKTVRMFIRSAAF